MEEEKAVGKKTKCDVVGCKKLAKHSWDLPSSGEGPWNEFEFEDRPRKRTRASVYRLCKTHGYEFLMWQSTTSQPPSRESENLSHESEDLCHEAEDSPPHKSQDSRQELDDMAQQLRRELEEPPKVPRSDDLQAQVELLKWRLESAKKQTPMPGVVRNRKMMENVNAKGYAIVDDVLLPAQRDLLLQEIKKCRGKNCKERLKWAALDKKHHPKSWEILTLKELYEHNDEYALREITAVISNELYKKVGVQFTTHPCIIVSNPAETEVNGHWHMDIDGETHVPPPNGVHLGVLVALEGFRLGVWPEPVDNVFDYGHIDVNLVHNMDEVFVPAGSAIIFDLRLTHAGRAATAGCGESTRVYLSTLAFNGSSTWKPVAKPQHRRSVRGTVPSTQYFLNCFGEGVEYMTA